MKSSYAWSLLAILLLSVVLSSNALADHSEYAITAHKSASAPKLDGVCNDPAWQDVKPTTVFDHTANAPFYMKAAYSGDQVFFCVQYKDIANSSFHKPWLWSKSQKKYAEGAHREDTFVFKWNMMDEEVNLSNFSDDSYTADIWYWKANRTNLAGYADDKTQILSDKPSEKSTETASATGKKRYLVRKSDAGKPPYKEIKTPPVDKIKPLFNRYEPVTPEGSRGDIKAKGAWSNGYWTIEFARKFNTGNNDDVQFDPESDRSYLFGVSIFSLYGRPLIMDQPNRYGMGRISDPLELVFE